MHILPFLDLAHLPQSPETTYDSIFFDSVLNPALPRIETRGEQGGARKPIPL
jgi:hypothetical protein